jgi:hypothetical protein
MGCEVAWLSEYCEIPKLKVGSAILCSENTLDLAKTQQTHKLDAEYHESIHGIESWESERATNRNATNEENSGFFSFVAFVIRCPINVVSQG